MLRRIQIYFQGVKPVVIDGALYVSWTSLTAVLGVFSGEEAYKYVNPVALFWLKASLTTSTAGLGALKMFRSTSFGNHVKNRDAQAALNNEGTKETKT